MALQVVSGRFQALSHFQTRPVANFQAENLRNVQSSNLFELGCRRAAKFEASHSRRRLTRAYAQRAEEEAARATASTRRSRGLRWQTRSLSVASPSCGMRKPVEKGSSSRALRVTVKAALGPVNAGAPMRFPVKGWERRSW